MIQNSQESRCSHWATRSSIFSSLAPLTYLLGLPCSLPSLASLPPLICPFAYSLPSSWESGLMDVPKRPGFATQCDGPTLSPTFVRLEGESSQIFFEDGGLRLSIGIGDLQFSFRHALERPIAHHNFQRTRAWPECMGGEKAIIAKMARLTLWFL